MCHWPNWCWTTLMMATFCTVNFCGFVVGQGFSETVCVEHVHWYDSLRRLIKNYTLGILTSGYIVLLSRVGENVAATMRKELFVALLRQDVAFFDASKTGQLVSRLTTDIQDFKSSFKLVIAQGLRSATQTLGCLVSLYFVSPKLTGLLVVVMPVLVGTGALLGSSLRKLSRTAQEQVAKATGVADEALGNVRTVKAFAMEDKEILTFSIEVDKCSHVNQVLGLGIGVFQGLSNLALNCIVLGTIYAGGSLIMREEMCAGDLMSFLVASQTIQRSLGSISILFGQVVRGLSAGARVLELMMVQPTIPLRGGALELKLLPPSSVLPSRRLAIVGQSGAGKSTIAALLERFYDPEVGVIKLDGYDIRTLDPSWLRSHVIGFINQEPVLFGTNIMENIRFASPEATDEEVYEAARQANADGFIRSFPDGYNTIVGERGASLSGGQKQRVAIARALIKNPRLLILDEATSALDTESERVVQEALDHAKKGRTVLVIAHRLSTIRAADVICVLDNGQIKEAGTHVELMQRGGLYAELIRRQSNPQPLNPDTK
uniref:Mitochondrial potassium channel ATP-binding subunit n=1 Tax=Callorhinchus milii TaxID=7868 RepID=A0A4W3GN88_CALMI